MTENKGKNASDQLDDEEDEDAQKDKHLTFRIANEDYGIEIAYVREIIGVQKITEVPEMPSFLKGVINLRGRVIPVIDVRTRFKMESRSYDDRTCVIVVNINSSEIGLVVDTVNEVITIPEADISPTPKISKGPANRFVRGMGRVGEEVKILLDVDKLLHDEELTELSVVEAPGNPSGVNV